MLSSVINLLIFFGLLYIFFKISGWLIKGILFLIVAVLAIMFVGGAIKWVALGLLAIVGLFSQAAN